MRNNFVKLPRLSCTSTAESRGDLLHQRRLCSLDLVSSGLSDGRKDFGRHEMLEFLRLLLPASKDQGIHTAFIDGQLIRVSPISVQRVDGNSVGLVYVAANRLPRISVAKDRREVLGDKIRHAVNSDDAGALILEPELVRSKVRGAQLRRPRDYITFDCLIH